MEQDEGVRQAKTTTIKSDRERELLEKIANSSRVILMLRDHGYVGSTGYKKKFNEFKKAVREYTNEFA